MKVLVRLAVAFAPLAATPLLLTGLASGRLDLGGGEKDLVWLLPWTLWSLLFAVASLGFWRRGWRLGRSSAGAALVGVAGVVLAALVLALFGQLGVAGRY